MASQCNGCSKIFKRLSGVRCEACQDVETAPKPRSEWPLCHECGRRFEFLTKPQCSGCEEADADAIAMPPPGHPALGRTSTPLSTQDRNLDIHYAMANPVNAKTHGTPLAVPRFNPHQGDYSDLGENDHRALNARKAFEDFQHGYANALTRASSQVVVSKPKFRGAEVAPSAPAKATLRINVVVRKIVNRNSKTLATRFDVQMTTYDDTRLWSEIQHNIIVWLDGIYCRNFGHRIRSSEDISIYYTYGRCVIDSIVNQADTTLRDLWKASTKQPGILIQSKHQKDYILDLDILVNYPPITDDNDQFSEELNTSYSSERLKRKAGHGAETSSTLRPYKRSSMGAYSTNITGLTVLAIKACEESFKVNKVTPGASPMEEWVESTEILTIFMEKTEFSAGKTKRAYKLRFSNSRKYYAAKSFYDTGSFEMVSNDENLQHLKEEFLRQGTLKEAVKAFNKIANEENIPIYDLQVAEDTFLITVCEGPRRGYTWLVDPLLDEKRMRKFSGTVSAGAHTDFAGKTCDTFAHFTLADSGYEFVPSDIQGIDSEITKDGVRGANAITLFDTMAHSRLCTMGLGDNGPEGIKLFCKQHKCNEICKRFKLPSCDEMLQEIEEEAKAKMVKAKNHSKSDSSQDDQNNSGGGSI